MIDFAVDAVLFDLDGTLVDSAASVVRAWTAVAAELGVPLADFEPYMHGIPVPHVLAAVLPSMPPEQASAWATRMNAEQALDTGAVKPTPGAVGALRALPPSRWAIVTSGDRRLATARIAAGGLPAPQVLVTHEDVPAGKPDPACYLLAAARLGVGAASCLVVEDAPAGVAAGRAAGMAVLGVLTTYPRLEADATTPDPSTLDIHANDKGVRVIERGP